MRSFAWQLLAVALVAFNPAVNALAWQPALSQAERQIFRDRLFQTNLRGPRWSTLFSWCFLCISQELLFSGKRQPERSARPGSFEHAESWTPSRSP